MTVYNNKELIMYEEEPSFFDRMDEFMFSGSGDALFTIIPIFIALIAFIVFFLIIKSIIQSVSTWNQNNKQPIVKEEAIVVGKRTSIRGGGETRAYNDYYVTFQLPQGERLEFQVKGTEYGQLIEKDQGELEYQGTRFLGFSRYHVTSE